MGLISGLKMSIYKFIRTFRCTKVMEVLDKDSKTMLDIGCQELYFYNRMKQNYDVTLADYEPKMDVIQKEDVHNLSFADNSFEIVICQQVLEHVPDPVKAMKELRRVARKQLVITVPNEPQFTNARLGNWEKEHLWAIKPMVFEYHLGKPDICTTMFFGRYCLFVWNF